MELINRSKKARYSNKKKWSWQHKAWNVRSRDETNNGAQGNEQWRKNEKNWWHYDGYWKWWQVGLELAPLMTNQTTGNPKRDPSTGYMMNHSLSTTDVTKLASLQGLANAWIKCWSTIPPFIPVPNLGTLLTTNSSIGSNWPGRSQRSRTLALVEGRLTNNSRNSILSLGKHFGVVPGMELPGIPLKRKTWWRCSITQKTLIRFKVRIQFIVFILSILGSEQCWTYNTWKIIC